MKKLVAVLLVWVACTVGPLAAQTFSGTLRWSMNVVITDPALKAQMDAVEVALSNPAMREMLLSNPQMRAMIEQQTGGSLGDASGGLFPKGLVLQIKGPRSLAKTEGGVSVVDILTLADKKVSYQIDRKARTYRKLPADQLKSVVGDYKVTPTTETSRVLGYLCRKFIIQTTDASDKSTYVVWATNEINGLDAKALRSLSLGDASSAELLTLIEGVPLKVNATTPQLNLTMAATSVRAETLPDTVFVMPTGFKETTAP